MAELKVNTENLCSIYGYCLLNNSSKYYIGFVNSTNNNLLLPLNKVNIIEEDNKYLISFITNKSVYKLNGKLDYNDIIIKNNNIYLTESGKQKYIKI